MSISANIHNLKNILGPGVKLLVVTKNHSVSEIEEAINSGVTLIAENRIQEAASKFPNLFLPVEKHFIGHLQTNKVKQAVSLFDVIQSIDSYRLAKIVDLEANKQQKIMPIFLQVNVANEPQKHGFDKLEILAITHKIGAELKNVKIRGLMAIMPLDENPQKAKPYFKLMRLLFNKIKSADLANVALEELSMGMTNDYVIALQEGSTMVRIGHGVFG
ncbi:MAG: alanine racemase domain-containing protein [Candidatus Peregrinibacteria bacterium GW2011_GWE2_39_6]|nr:MAG: alanine racemase domain-containing protein [Candidatus Peregrinibacteria bacterium GW2011_GWF2_39_17]KKR24046.1 MAG: alanine racemase domain-containing protein [Candidatus Peregrinibacteria bacterium GW2011_GWE2_39_6]HCW31896.1 YggS family pyridoxal phosphate-dependent enzyme [Candidatus Peregrinibacteria bacterium]